MKALTIKQPWASLIAHGIKDIENRTWRTNFRGRIYIHASAKSVGNDLETIINYEQFKSIPEDLQHYFTNGIWQTSTIIGEVDIIDCVINHPSIWAEKAQPYDFDEFYFPLYKKPVYNWVLANPVLYDKPILNVKGKLRFWEYEGLSTGRR